LWLLAGNYCPYVVSEGLFFFLVSPNKRWKLSKRLVGLWNDVASVLRLLEAVVRAVHEGHKEVLDKEDFVVRQLVKVAAKINR